MMLPARRGAWWDANKIGLSPPLIETERGWLMVYHGVRHTPAGCLYRLGVALFDLEDPAHLLLRGDEWIFGPEAPYERHGDVAYVTFPCGSTIGRDGDTLNLYYGAADTCIAMATGSIREILGWLDRHGGRDRLSIAGVAVCPALRRLRVAMRARRNDQRRLPFLPRM